MFENILTVIIKKKNNNNNSITCYQKKKLKKLELKNNARENITARIRKIC